MVTRPNVLQRTLQHRAAARPASARSTIAVTDISSRLHAEFVQMVTTKANDVSVKSKKSTVQGDHVVQAVRELCLEEWAPALEEALAEVKESSKSAIRGLRGARTLCGWLARCVCSVHHGWWISAALPLHQS